MAMYACMLGIVDEYEMSETFNGFSTAPVVPFRFVSGISFSENWSCAFFEDETISVGKLLVRKGVKGVVLSPAFLGGCRTFHGRYVSRDGFQRC